MKERDFVATFPELYHMAHEASWTQIQTHGLLSTTMLLDLFEITGAERQRIEECHRSEVVKITHAKHGDAYIRDQKPLRMSALEKCLEGVTPKEWLKLLNSKVFLWPTFEKVEELSNARAYRNQKHCLIAIDTLKLLKIHVDDVSLTPINVGATLYSPAKRSPGIFSSIEDFPKRKTTDNVKEVAISLSIPSINSIVNSVYLFRNGKRVKRLF